MSDPIHGSVILMSERVERLAGDLRNRAAALVTAASVTAWQSLAAGRFRAEVDNLARGMRAAAMHVDDAASALRRHAAAAAHPSRLLSAAEAVPAAMLRRGLSRLER